MYSTGNIDKKEVDQPKPTTDSFAPFFKDAERKSNAELDELVNGPKPTTGEWTAETVNQLLYDDNKESRLAVADAHNATRDWCDRTRAALAKVKEGK